MKNTKKDYKKREEKKALQSTNAIIDNTNVPEAPKSPANQRIRGFPDILQVIADFLKTEKALLVFNLALVSVQATFVRDLFESTTTAGAAYGYIYGFGYELTGLTLALNGSTRWALRLFAVISFLIIGLEVGFFAGWLTGWVDASGNFDHEKNYKNGEAIYPIAKSSAYDFFVWFSILTQIKK